VDVRPETLDLELIRSFPDGALRRLQAVPLFRSEGRVTAAIADPTDGDAIQEFERLCEAPATCVAATPSAIEQTLDEILGRRPAVRPHAAEAPEGGAFDVLWERSGETFLNFHLAQARRLGTTEIHFVCADGWLYVKHRAATRLTLLAREPASVMDVLVARFESLGMPPLHEGEEHRSFSTACEIGGLVQGVQVSLLVTRDGPSATVRLLRDPDVRPRLEALGLEPLDVAQLRELLDEPSGLLLVSGPSDADCGRTLDALLAEAATEERRWAVFTGDRRRWPGVTGPVTVVSGPAALHWRRIAADHAVDGMVLDGGLDGRRVRGLLHGAVHGRWVLARTDWEDSFALLDWLMRAPGGRVAIARRLRAVIQQRLVATPRANTAASAGTLDPRGPEAAVTAPGGPDAPLQRAVFEVLLVGEALRAAVLAGAGAAELRAIAEREGFHPLSDSLRAGVQRGLLDPRDASRAVA
jgi:type II secretory ATPase GspE/PulE/Tfp pilus assembly ATPase PilB-like protein